MTARPIVGPPVAATAASDRVAAVGLVGAAAIAIASLVAALPYRGLVGEPYSPLNHYISELGERGVSTLAPLFSAGLMVGGACLALFLVGLVWCTSGGLRFGVAGVGAVSGIAGALVGVFPMNERSTHSLVAFTFFMTAWVAVGLFTVHVARDARDRLSRRLLIPGVLSVAAFVSFLVVFAVAASAGDLNVADIDRPAVWIVPLLEWLALISILVWVPLVAIDLLRRPTEV